MQHTKEPWLYVPHYKKYAQGHIILELTKTGYTIEITGPASMTQKELDAHADRIIECVNGCAGIINPSAVREVVEAAKLADGIAGTLMDELVGNKATDWGIVNNGLVKIHKALEALNKGG